MRTGTVRQVAVLKLVLLYATLLCPWHSWAGELPGTIQEPIRPIPNVQPPDLGLVSLGEKLFSDRRLSRNGKMACMDCHDLSRGGTDGKIISVSANGEKSQVNTPTLYNVRYNTRYYWSGKFTSLSKQIHEALIELDSDWPMIVNRLSRVDEYNNAFAEQFADGLTANNVKKALIAFEESLITPNSAFDNFLSGNKNAITKQQQRGYSLFKSYGCVTCHQGRNIGGNILLDKNHIPFEGSGGKKPKTSATNQLKKIRVPSLRNVALTAPYLHDGSIPKLNTVVEIMGQRYTGLKLPKKDIKAIVSFLQTLTGQYNGKPL